MAKKINIKSNEEEIKDTGFSARNIGQRVVNKDGSYNVERKGLPFFRPYEIFHKLITMSWTKFSLILISGYIILNVFFAALYMVAGVEKLDGLSNESGFKQYMDAFFFSAQTFTTVGYGKISPVGISANLISSFESMTGLLSFALATGLLYGRFSRPVAKFIFSEKAIIAPYKEGSAVMFRLANARSNQVLNTEAQMVLALNDKSRPGNTRRFFNLTLEPAKITMFPLTWTVVHPINEKSPLQYATESDLEDWDAEFLILISGFDDTFAQTIHSRTSYKYNEVEWGAKFTNIYGANPSGVTTVALDRIGEYEKAELMTMIPQAN